ncbi:hypothetical protein ANCCAN_21406 [Ancylostoma caninum]|uniref:Uncharacterized protein n=1 Tax=Ancylostoma caninum TaxID=29170 RepID=A0A368FPQ3_ANCCA|nr:hypothetical protein ANCCAN_21406 [Ancylostoma caninum]
MFPSKPTTLLAADESKSIVITATGEDEPGGDETILFESAVEEESKFAIPAMEEDVKEADTALNAAALLADADTEPVNPVSITVAESTSTTVAHPPPITLVGDVKTPVLQATSVTIPVSAETNQPVILIPVTNFPTPTLKQLVPIQIQQPVCITVAADAVSHLFRLASTGAPKQPSAFDALVHDPWIPEPPGPRFPGRRQVSKLGLRPVMSYEIPGSRQSYVFSLERANIAYDLFECVQCKRNGKRTTIKGVGEEFIGDPCQLSHRCIPVNTKDFVLQRLTYEKRQEIRKETVGLTRSQLKKKLKAVKEEIARELFCASEGDPGCSSSSRKGQYVGQPQASEHGPVLVYPAAEGSPQVYMFAKCKSHKNYDVYDCVLCREKGKHTFVRVCGVTFQTNPSKLPHKCDPVESGEDLSTSLTSEVGT